MPANLKHLLDQLDELKTQFDRKSAQLIEQTLAKLTRSKVDDAESLVRLHELLLFVRAHPHNKKVLKQAESALRD